MNLNQITVPVMNIPKSIDFYKGLGLKLIVHTDDNYARFECPVGSTTFSLHRVDRLPTGNGIWVYFEVEDVDQTVAELSSRIANLVIEEQPEDKPWLWREARFKDLDSNQIIIYKAGKNRQNPPWRLQYNDSL